jgi:hypothetical protein
MSWSLLSKPQSDSTFYPEGYSSVKVTVSLDDLKVFFLCPACHILAKTTSATYTVKR